MTYPAVSNLYVVKTLHRQHVIDSRINANFIDYRNARLFGTASSNNRHAGTLINTDSDEPTSLNMTYTIYNSKGIMFNDELEQTPDRVQVSR
jgi:hypothetical protein